MEIKAMDAVYTLWFSRVLIVHHSDSTENIKLIF